ncbi:MAG: YfcE family phosphodiesterase [Desulfobulbaceae bacterium]|jgi:putative phosphoesterase|nr:YfcE family phosphodiesterase [Desulfobulbaceae bacterium]
MTIKAGILSDTHLSRPDERFTELAAKCFADCDVIIHAGDLTGTAVLEVFAGRPVYAVHGNMCDAGSHCLLPREMTFRLGDFTIGLTHGAHLGRDIESSLWGLFPDADCMVYGHTHHPVIHRLGGVLIINPGSFRGTGPYGAPGTYAILAAGRKLSVALHETGG